MFHSEDYYIYKLMYICYDYFKKKKGQKHRYCWNYLFLLHT